MDAAFLTERITVTKALIVAYEDALTALAGNPALSYTIDTGQTRTTVTRVDIPRINTLIASLYNRLATLEARRDGSGVTNVSPAW